MSDTPHDLSPRLGGQNPPPGDEPALTGDRALLHALELLSVPDKQTRQDAVFALAKLGDERAIEQLVAIIRDENQVDEMNSRAALALARFGPLAIPHFVALAQDDNPEVSETGMWGLFPMAEYHPGLLRKVIRIMTGFLEHGPDLRRERAARLIRLMTYQKRPPGIIPALLRALDDDSQMVRLYAMIALGHLHNDRAVPKLHRLLNDSDSVVCRGAAEALDEIGTRKAVRVLKEWRQRNPPSTDQEG